MQQNNSSGKKDQILELPEGNFPTLINLHEDKKKRHTAWGCMANNY